MLNVSLLGLIYGAATIRFAEAMLARQPDAAVSFNPLMILMVGLSIAFFMHGGLALFIWVFCRGIGGSVQFMPTYLYIEQPPLPSGRWLRWWPPLQAGASGPLPTVCALAAAIYGASVLFCGGQNRLRAFLDQDDRGSAGHGGLRGLFFCICGYNFLSVRPNFHNGFAWVGDLLFPDSSDEPSCQNSKNFAVATFSGIKGPMISGYHQYFKAFADVSKAIHSGMETGEILGRIVASITETMAAKGCIYWIINRQTASIEHKVSSGFDYRSLSGVDLATLQTIFPADAESMVFIADARYDDRLPDLERLGKRRVVSVIGMPVEIVPPYGGILAVYFGMKRDLSRAEVEFLTALGEQGAIALHKALRYDERLLDTFRQTVEGLAMALEAKHPETHGHSLNVARLAKITALEMGLTEKEAQSLYQAGLLHDIGKIGTGREILGRLGHLSNREMDLVRIHPGGRRQHPAAPGVSGPPCPHGAPSS